MSKIGYVGSTFRIIWNGDILAAVRTKSVQHIRAAIDVSHEERDGWRHLDPKYESVGVEISVEGVATPTNYALLEQWLGDTFTDLMLVFPDGTIELAEDGAFLRSLSYGGEHQGFVSFSAQFIFSGRVSLLEPIVLTSWPYSYIALDELDVVFPMSRGAYPPFFIEPLDVGFSMTSGSLITPLVEYEWTEELDVGFSMEAGALVDPLVVYEWPIEELGVAFTMTEGAILDVLVEYTLWPIEELDLG
nr:hypothetical protein [Gammaproteobacteria bacterium]